VAALAWMRLAALALATRARTRSGAAGWNRRMLSAAVGRSGRSSRRCCPWADAGVGIAPAITQAATTAAGSARHARAMSRPDRMPPGWSTAAAGS